MKPGSEKEQGRNEAMHTLEAIVLLGYQIEKG
jgi:hypothetical protein